MHGGLSQPFALRRETNVQSREDLVLLMQYVESPKGESAEQASHRSGSRL
jgi:hypothetical protein